MEQETITISWWDDVYDNDDDEVETDHRKPESRPGMVSGVGHGARETGRTTLLGYFLHNSLRREDHLWVYPCPNTSTWFLCTSEEGKEVVQGKWGDLDPTLSFIGSQVDIVGSCNGFLLCLANPEQNMSRILNLQNMDYIICNPVTRQFRHLPRPRKPYFSVALGFICKGENVLSVDEIDFEVLRAEKPSFTEFVTSVMIETFTSRTNRWTEARLVCDSPFRVNAALNARPVVIGEMIFWCADSTSSSYALLAFDRSKGLRAQLIEPPPGWDGQKFVCQSHRCGTSDGKLLFARCGHRNLLEVWGLEDYWIKPTWAIKHRVRFPDLGVLIIREFHPHNPDLVLITSSDRPFWYDVQHNGRNLISNALFPPVQTFVADCFDDEEREYFYSQIPGANYFLYEWPASGYRPPPTKPLASALEDSMKPRGGEAGHLDDRSQRQTGRRSWTFRRQEPKADMGKHFLF